MICALLMWIRQWNTANETIRYYGHQRTKNMKVFSNLVLLLSPPTFKGLTIPSQIRYVYYFERYLYHPDLVPASQPLVLRGIKMNAIPNFKGKKFCLFLLFLSLTSPLILIRSFTRRPQRWQGSLWFCKSGTSSPPTAWKIRTCWDQDEEEAERRSAPSSPSLQPQSGWILRNQRLQSPYWWWCEIRYPSQKQSLSLVASLSLSLSLSSSRSSCSSGWTHGLLMSHLSSSQRRKLTSASPTRSIRSIQRTSRSRSSSTVWTKQPLSPLSTQRLVLHRQGP